MNNVSGIYSITNKIDNKRYIGCSKKLSVRKRQHFLQLENDRHANEYLQNAFNKHGNLNFSFDILEECDISNLYIREDYWINKFNSCDRIFGYNILPPDPKGFIGQKTPEIIEKIRKANIGKKASDETRRRLSESHKGQISWMKGRNHSEETRKRISEIQIGRKQSKETVEKRIKHNKIPILQYDLNGNFIKKWLSSRDAERELGIDGSHISCCVTGKRTYADGFIWRKFKNNYPLKINEVVKQNISVSQYNLTGELIETYKSLMDAERKTGIDYHCISKCVKGNLKTAGKFKWKMELND